MPKARERGLTNEKRSEVVRERVIDYLNFAGGRRGPQQMENVREDFCRAALRCAEHNGMRVWKDGTHRPLDGARSSLQVLLKEKRVVQGGMVATGVNSSWVLDIWEAALDYLMRQSVFARRREAAPETETEPEQEAGGIRVVAEATPVGRLSLRLLEAYLEQDQDAMMQIALEVEALEQRMEATPETATG